jgi:DNA-binding transcriptional regulator PaaX
MIETRIETLARDLCDTYYLSVDPWRRMTDAYSKISEKTREHWRAQAELLLQRGWANDARTARRTRKVTRSRRSPKSRW